MITKLRVKNFKSWKDTDELSFAPLTGIFGANSSGKTSILQMLLLLKQTVESQDRKRVLHTGDIRSLVDMGTFFDLVHGHKPDEKLMFSLSWERDESIKINDPETENQILYDVKSLSFSTQIRDVSNRLVVDWFEYCFGDNKFGMRRKADSSRADKDQYDLIHSGYPAKRIQGRAWPLPSPVKCYGFPDEATGYYQNVGFIPDFVLAFEALFSGISYLGPLRDYPKRSYLWAGERPTDVGRRGEHAVEALLAARVEGIKSGKGTGKRRRYKLIEERILEWLREMRLIDSFSLKPIAENRKDYEFRIKTSKTSPEVLITDVGFGVSQILPVLVLCYYAPERTTVLLEQPEIHLHPSVQATLADVLIEIVTERNIQIIVESHSEHLLRRLQRRIAEQEIARDKTAFYFCRIEDATSKIEMLDVDSFGNIRNWPDGFFGDEIGDLVAMTTANIERQRDGQGE